MGKLHWNLFTSVGWLCILIDFVYITIYDLESKFATNGALLPAGVHSLERVRLLTHSTQRLISQANKFKEVFIFSI